MNPPPAPLRLAALLSGGGRTILNVHDEVAAGRLNAKIVRVISSRTGAAAVDRCRARGLSVEVVERCALDEDAFSSHVAARLREARAELVLLAGLTTFWRIPADFAGRVINIHPALLPRFGGKGFYGDRVHRAVLDAGCRRSGCSVHFADNVYDHGPVILQREVPVHADDTEDALAARVFIEECIAFPEAIRRFISGQLPLPDPVLARNH